jgi:hypothetical protein
MFAEVTIHAGKQVNAIVIPSEAVIRSGSRNQVFVVRAPGKFEPRLVTLGLASNGKVAVLEGIKVGEEVVTSSQFLIDSESKLREATAKMLQGINDKSQQKTDKPIKIDHQTSDQTTMKQMNHSMDMSEHSSMKQMNHQQAMPDHSRMKHEMEMKK